MTTHNIQPTLSTLLKTSESQFVAAAQESVQGDFRAAVQTARKAGEILVRSVKSSENFLTPKHLREALHKIPLTPLIAAAWEKSFWKLRPTQQRDELVLARTNMVLEKRANEIHSVLFLLDKGREAHVSRDFSNAACLTLEATRRAVKDSPEQKRAARMWSVYAIDLDTERKAIEVFTARKQKLPALDLYIDDVDRHEVLKARPHRLNRKTTAYERSSSMSKGL
jgi:hypothetical protein